jgi:hypothetical protein
MARFWTFENSLAEKPEMRSCAFFSSRFTARMNAKEGPDANLLGFI